MNKRIKIIIVMFLLLIVFAFLELISYEGCVCTHNYYPTVISKIIGYLLLIISILLFFASICRVKKLSRYWTIPAVIIFVIAFYGNGYMLFSLIGGCGNSINKTTFFVNQTKLGDFATDWGPINTESLHSGKFDGKLLGYSISGKNLRLYRIGDKPLKVKTSFLFWKAKPIFIPALHSYRNLEYEQNNDGYEFIGGQDMPVEVFLNEFVINHSEFAGKKLKNQRIINETDGTTRFRFEVE